MPATSLAIMQQQKGAIMKLATLGLATALAFTSSYALAQSSGGSASGSSATGGAATSGTTTGSPAAGTTTGNAMGTPEHRHVQQRRQRRGRREQRAEPVREHAYQSLAQRFDPDAGTWRPIIAGRQQKAPLRRGFFHSRQSPAATSSLPATSCISRRRASPVARALPARVRWRRARRWRDRENAFSPPRFRRRSWPRHSVSR